MVPDDCTLVRNVLNGDRQSFDELIARYIPRIFQLVYRFFNTRHQAEDIVQEVMLQAYQSLGSYGQERPFISWLTTLAVRRCYRELKLRSNRAEAAITELSLPEQACLERCLHTGTNAADPETALIARDITTRLLAALSAREQLVLILRDVEGLSVGETSRMMGISQLHVKVVSHRARKHAQNVLALLAITNTDQKHPQEHQI